MYIVCFLLFMVLLKEDWLIHVYVQHVCVTCDDDLSKIRHNYYDFATMCKISSFVVKMWPKRTFLCLIFASCDTALSLDSKFIVPSSPCLKDHVCQMASKFFHLLYHNILIPGHADKFRNRWTNGPVLPSGIKISIWGPLGSKRQIAMLHEAKIEHKKYL